MSRPITSAISRTENAEPSRGPPSEAPPPRRTFWQQLQFLAGDGANLRLAGLIVAKLIVEGKSLDEAVAAKPYADIGAKIGATEEQNANFVRLIYSSLKP